ncbi:MAG: RtcB family protein [Anaerolineae bacterium]|nr:RtcB family protein [Anaerolineae bacterium]
MENVKMWTEGVPIEYDALTQIRNISQLPILAGHVAIMPDVHVGKGAVVGSVIPTERALIPAAVGVDIACGMCAVRLDLHAEDLPTKAAMREAIERRVPVGFNTHPKTLRPLHDGLAGQALDRRIKDVVDRADGIRLLKWEKKFNWSRVGPQIGTLGGGNHFIEVCLDEDARAWLMLHSGSRNAGKTIGEAATRMAMAYGVQAGQALPDKQLSWLDEGTEEFELYVEGLLWAQDYALLNRDVMLHLAKKALSEVLDREVKEAGEAVNCHHNFSQVEEHGGRRFWVTRKGATRAGVGERGIIPGSMGARSYIVEGKGNPDAYLSCSHGAGRVMSRGAAKKAFTLADLEAQTAGIECRKDTGVLDEIPKAYKPIDLVMEAQKDLVGVLHELRQVVCVKG